MIYFFSNLFHGGSNSDKEMSLPSTGGLCCPERKKKNPTENDEEHFLEKLNTLVTGSSENETLSKLLILNKWFPFPPEQ